MRINTLATAALFVVVTAAGAGCFSSTDASPDQQWALVQNHVFIDHMPKNQRDMVKQIAFVDQDGQRLGVRGASSRFRMFIDVFAWNRKGPDVDTVILQTNDLVKARFKAWSCKGSAPAPFELCLELRGGDQVRKYYSRRDWIIEGADAAHLDAALAGIGVDENAAPVAAGANDDDASFPL